MNARVASWIGFAALAALGSGCREDAGAKQKSRTDAVALAEAAVPSPSLLSREGLEKLAEALRAQGGSKPSLLMLDIAADHAVAQLETTARSGEIVQVEWRGGELSAPTPVELGGKGTVAQNVFPLGSVDLFAIPALASSAVQRVDPAGGSVSHVLIRKNLPHDESIGVRVYVDSPLRPSHVDADARGKLVDQAKYP